MKSVLPRVFIPLALLLLVAACSRPGGDEGDASFTLVVEAPVEGEFVRAGGQLHLSGFASHPRGIRSVEILLGGVEAGEADFDSTTGEWRAVLAAPEDEGELEVSVVARAMRGAVISTRSLNLNIVNGVMISGAVDVHGMSVTVCVDTNRNLECDVGEPASRVEAGEEFAIWSPVEVSEASAFLVAEFREPLSAPDNGEETFPFALAAPVNWQREITVLSTLVALSLEENSDRSPERAYGSVADRLGVIDPELLLSNWPTLEPVAVEGFRAAWRVASEDGGDSLEVARRSGSALTSSLGRYLDSGKARLLSPVSAYSVATDAAGSLRSGVCQLPHVAQMEIETADYEPVVEKKKYLDAILTLRGAKSSEHNVTLETQVRGRGNSTWGMPKKPFRIKLTNEHELLGMPINRSWALLANYADKTMLRNAVAFCAAEILGMPYTPDSEFVELTFNGEYLGLYQLTDKTYEVQDLVKAQAKEGSSEEGFSDVFVLEIDDRRKQDFWFDSQNGIPFGFRSKADAAHVERVEEWINSIEALIADSSDPDRLARVNENLDIESLVDIFLVNELTRNGDAFWSSTYLYRLRGERVTFGPVWDFDIALGNIDYGGHGEPEGSSTLGASKSKSWYIRTLLDEPEFRALIAARWEYLSSRVPLLVEFVEESAAVFDEAQGRNFERWPILDEYVWPNAVVTGSYEGEIDYLLLWLEQRVRWMEAQY